MFKRSPGPKARLFNNFQLHISQTLSCSLYLPFVVLKRTLATKGSSCVISIRVRRDC